MKNLVNIETSWEKNGWLSKTKLSSAELYRKYMIEAESTNIQREETLLSKMQKAFKMNVTESGTSSRVSSGRGKKVVYGLVAAAALCLGILGCIKISKNQPEEEKHLSSIA